MLKFLNNLYRVRFTLLMFLMAGCAGMSRDCASCLASNYGADWIVVTNGADGRIINCWQLSNIAIENESGTDGVFWREGSGHLVHISGWYNRVQVSGGNFATAAKAIGVDIARCTGGQYNDSVQPAPVKPIDTQFDVR